MDFLYTDALKHSSFNGFNVMVKPAGPVCNLNCTYCYYLEKKNLYPDETKFRLNYAVLEDFIKQYIECQEVKVVNFTWQGGEPTLLGLDYFRKVIELQKKYSNGKRIENAFQTNGTLLNDDWCKFFIENNILVGISIDGKEHNHDYFRKYISEEPSFQKVMSGLELLHKHKVQFNTLSCVNSYNADFAVETYRFLKEIGSGYIQFIPIVEKNNTLPSKENSYLEASDSMNDSVVTPWSVNGKDYGNFLITIFNDWVRRDVGKYFIQIFDVTLANYAGVQSGLCVFSETCGDALVMEHNGDLFSCDHYVYPEYLLGNINDSILVNIVKSQRQLDFGIDKRNKLPEYCIKCDVRYACHGECPKHRILKTPDEKPGLNYLCVGYKNFFHHVEPYMDYMAIELKNKRAPANVMNWAKTKDSLITRAV